MAPPLADGALSLAVLPRPSLRTPVRSSRSAMAAPPSRPPRSGPPQPPQRQRRPSPAPSPPSLGSPTLAAPLPPTWTPF